MTQELKLFSDSESPVSYWRWQMAVEWHPDAFNKKLMQNMERRMIDSVLVVENKAKRRCPKKTGRLAGSITHWIAIQYGFLSGYASAGGKTYDGTNVHYAIYQELGTKYMAGRFYMRGAQRESYDTIRKIWGIK